MISSKYVRIGQQERSLIMRFVVAYGILLFSFFIVSSKWLGDVMEHSFVGPVNFNAFPLVLVGLMLGLFVVVVRDDVRKKKLPPLRMLQIIIALCLVALAVIASYIATHPSLEWFFAMHLFIQVHPVAGGPFVAVLLYLALLLPVMPALALTVPWQFLLRHGWLLLVGFFIFIGYLFTNLLEALFHQFTAPLVLRWCAALLSLFPGTTTVQSDRWELTYRGFGIVLGPVCSGFTMLVLFLGIFGFVWMTLARKSNVAHGRAFILMLSGLLILWCFNILRVVLIMFVGAASPSIGIILFHGAAGAVMFFLVFLFYIKLVVPMIRIRKKTGRKSR